MLTVIKVGHDEASDRYVRNKVRAITNAGMEVNVVQLDESMTTDELVTAVHMAEADPRATAVMVQLPLPPHIDKKRVLAAIPPEMDIDGLNPASDWEPLTPCAIMRWLDTHGLNVAGHNVVIFGRSDLVGKPLARMMLDAGAAVSIIHSQTNPRIRSLLCRRADIVVSAMGRTDVLEKDFNYEYREQYPMLIIDVGINRDADGHLCGDVSSNLRQWVEWHGGTCTPVPGGVGKWTVEELVLRLKEMEELKNKRYER